MTVRVHAPPMGPRYDHGVRAGVQGNYHNATQRDESQAVVNVCGNIGKTAALRIDITKIDNIARELGVQLEQAAALYLLAEAGHADRKPPPIVSAEIEGETP
jgi:hypothetical protein